MKTAEITLSGFALVYHESADALEKCSSSEEEVAAFKEGAEKLFRAFQGGGLCSHLDFRLFELGEVGKALGGVELTWEEHGDEPNAIMWLENSEGLAVIENGEEYCYDDPRGGLFDLVGVLIQHAFGPPD